MENHERAALVLAPAVGTVWPIARMIERCSSVEQRGWLALREALWPECSHEEHLAEMAEFLTRPGKYAVFVAYATDGLPVGLAEASVRTEYVNGTSVSPVGFLEGLYVVPERRQQGVARALVDRVSDWALSMGCLELASDTQVENTVSQSMHKALGFTETERVVLYCKPLRGVAGTGEVPL